MTSPPSAATLIRVLWASIDAHDEAAVGPLIHPDATLEMAMARGSVIEGRDAVMGALREAWSEVHSVTINNLYEVSATVVVIDGRSRHPAVMGGFADTGVIWLCEFRDQMLWRQRLFTTVDEALSLPESVTDMPSSGALAGRDVG